MINSAARASQRPMRGERPVAAALPAEAADMVSGLVARFAGAEQIGYAAAAGLGVVGVAAHVQAPVPAAFALLVRRRRDLDPQPAFALMDGGARETQNEEKVVAQ